MKEIKLRTIDWEIYNVIKKRSEQGLWTCRKAILEYLRGRGGALSERELRKSINRIRNCDTIQKVLLISSAKEKGYKFFTSSSDVEYLVKERIKLLKMLKTYYKNITRLEKNGQYRIVFNKERNIIESVLKEE